jgi:3-oxoacyl-[acyl-carrier-protein] synthase-1
VPIDIERDFPVALQRTLGSAFPLGLVHGIARGHASGLLALEAACRTVETGRADFCLVGGVDSYVEPETLEWLEANEQVHSAGSSNNAWGFIPGEAAGFCLLMSIASARRHGIEPLGHVRAVTAAREEHLIKSDTVCLGRGLTAAFAGVFDALPSPSDVVNDVICDMNGEPYRAEEFGFATIRTRHRFMNESEFQTPADCWGDVGAASGPLFVNLAVVAQAKGYAAGPRTLVWTSSESGERAAAVIEV